MRKGRKRHKTLDGKVRAWVSEGADESGEWLSESEYRASGCSPDFDSLPLWDLVVQRFGPFPISDEELQKLSLGVPKKN